MVRLDGSRYGKPGRLGRQHALHLGARPRIDGGSRLRPESATRFIKWRKAMSRFWIEAGLKLDDIVGGFVYLSDMQDYAPMNAVYKEYYSRGPGVRTCLMPGSGIDKTGVRVRGAFVAARTR